ncbi:hypothetical protein [Bacillus sp. EB600]|uniref:hypothetical protein n=1 Tax=Bacillus sp. EB600 TaxID=2806345 RepID=UPI00210E90F9|nr:hypothetical protein [Bacillus sp. EB600]MCQ6281501.1 hypothetical protein [Bacillus sp. EB600]
MKLAMTTQIKLVPLKIHKDQKHFIVEDMASGEFYEMTEVCIDAIKMIQTGAMLAEIESQLKQKYPEEEVDLLNFAEQLLELELIEVIDGVRMESKQKRQQPSGFLWISSKAGRFFFNKLAIILYLVLFIANLSLLIFHHNLFPQYRDMFIFDLMVLNIPAWLVLTFVLVIIHEFGHVLAVRAYGLPTKLEVGHRLFLVVLETDMSSAWKLPAKDRNVLYSAGLCFDTVILFLALISQLAIPSSSPILHRILQVMVLNTFIRVVYQLCVYMKTDLYYVFENSTGCYNLMENAQQLLRNRFKLLHKTPAAGDVVFDSERKTVLWYSIFYIVGVVLTIALYIGFYIPQLLYAFHKILPEFRNPITSLSFWDAAVFVIQILLGFVLLVYSWTKKYRQAA